MCVCWIGAPSRRRKVVEVLVEQGVPVRALARDVTKAVRAAWCGAAPAVASPPATHTHSPLGAAAHKCDSTSHTPRLNSVRACVQKSLLPGVASGLVEVVQGDVFQFSTLVSAVGDAQAIICATGSNDIKDPLGPFNVSTWRWREVHCRWRRVLWCLTAQRRLAAVLVAWAG